MTKLCFIDVETTGLDPFRNGIVQLAGQIVYDGVPEESFNYRMRPLMADIILPEALQASIQETVETVKKWPDPHKIHKQFIDRLGQHVDRYDKTDKMWFVAYNAKFDYDAIRAWFLKLEDGWFGSFFFHPYLDVMTMAGAYLMDRRTEMENFQQATVAGALGIPVEEDRLHDAAYDIELTRAIWDIIQGNV